MALTQQEVSELYVAIFNRAGEGEGNSFWIGTGYDSATIVDEMLATADAQAYFGDSLDTNQAFVEHIYLNTLNKTVADDAAGIAYWVDLLDAGSSRGVVVTGLIEAINDPANAGDAQDQFNNRVAVANYTANTLETAPADYATSLSFGADLVVTNDSATVITAFAAVDVLADAAAGGDEDPDAPVAGDTFMLTTAQDNLTGTENDDEFVGYIFDNQNTAQSGDMVDGGAGDDSLFADIGDSQNFAITLSTNSVENFAVRAQAQAEGNDSNDNNMTNAVQIDAERMDGTDRYESNNSRADVIMEDVRIEDTQITQDITVAMVQTDPGLVDLGVYFDVHSLRAQGDTTSGAGLDLDLMDVESATAGLDPLLQNPYDVVTFTLDGVEYSLTLKSIGNVNTYADLQAAITLALSANADLADVTAEIIPGHTFPGINSNDGTLFTGTSITLVNAGSGVFEAGSWSISGEIPASGEYLNDQTVTDPTASSSLITADIVLDDVGRGSMGGDLVVGALSTGATSDSTGVEQFNIFVDRTSELQEIQSTNNTLEEVFIVNRDDNDSNDTATGSLTVAGDTNADNDLPGADADAYGFTDVRVLDASTMVGSVNLDAGLSAAVVAKYMNSVDTAADAGADNVNFIYTLGTADDSLALEISDANLAAAGTTTREDFTLAINGGTGNDTINTVIVDDAGILADGAGTDLDFWYLNSQANANLSINGGTGNDTITTTGAGDYVIAGEAGDDTVYTNNDGNNALGLPAQWAVANAASVATTDLLNTGNVAAAWLQDTLVTVTYSGATTAGASGVTGVAALAATNGFESTATVATTNGVGNQLNINNAIKDAINNDDVLNKLIVATDGPSDTLVITSLVDGTFIAGDLDIALTTTDVVGLAAGDLATQTANYQAFVNDSSAVYNQAAADSVVNGAGAFAAGATFNTVTVLDDLAIYDLGAPSVSASDNAINLGTGNDNLIMGTDATSNDTLVVTGAFGNDTVFNFDDDTTNTTIGAEDILDFTALLTDLEDIPASGSTVSQTRIATTANNDFLANGIDVTENEILFANDIVFGAGESLEGLTGAALTAALNGTTAYANIAASAVTSLVTAINTQTTSILFVENNGVNAGEYAVYQVTADDALAAGSQFTAATLLGTLDFGAEISTGAEVASLVDIA